VPQLIEWLVKCAVVVLTEDAEAMQFGVLQRGQDFGFGEVPLAMDVGLDLFGGESPVHLECRFANRARGLLA
jgi:hypothetical protein